MPRCFGILPRWFRVPCVKTDRCWLFHTYKTRMICTTDLHCSACRHSDRKDILFTVSQKMVYYYADSPCKGKMLYHP